MPRPKPKDFMAAMADQDGWADQGACVQDDASLFDTVRMNRETLITDEVQVALDICTDCPVMMACLEHAVRFDMRDGVWGGMVYEDRLWWAWRNHPEWLTARARREIARWLEALAEQEVLATAA